MNLNKAMLIGNLTRDPEVRQTAGGQSVASFAVATNMVWTDQSGQRQERVEYHNIVAWRKLADICGRFLHKGSKVYIEGRLQTRDWTGKDGAKRYTTEIVAENLIMLDSRGGASASLKTDLAQSASTAGEPVINYDELPEEATSAEEEIKVENIPF